MRGLCSGKGDFVTDDSCKAGYLVDDIIETILKINSYYQGIKGGTFKKMNKINKQIKDCNIVKNINLYSKWDNCFSEHKCNCYHRRNYK